MRACPLNFLVDWPWRNSIQELAGEADVAGRCCAIVAVAAAVAKRAGAAVEVPGVARSSNGSSTLAGPSHVWEFAGGTARSC